MARTQSATEIGMEALRRYPEVIEDISPRDLMFKPDRPEVYWGLGRAGMDVLRLCLLAAQKGAPQSILDLPSGHGRVLRFLRAEYPDAHIAACEIDHEAVDFCAQTFGAEPVHSHEHPGQIKLSRRYELIWSGSLFSHLNAPMWDEFFNFFDPAMDPNGLLVISTQGREIERRLNNPDRQDFYMPSAEAREQILAGYRDHGFGFAEYPTSKESRATRSEPSSYGIALARPSWLFEFVARRGFQVVTFMENRYGGQDVIALTRMPAPLRIPLG